GWSPASFRRWPRLVQKTTERFRSGGYRLSGRIASSQQSRTLRYPQNSKIFDVHESEAIHIALACHGLNHAGTCTKWRHPCLAHSTDRAKSSIVVTRAAASEFFCCP